MENNEQITLRCTLSYTDPSVPLGMRIFIDNKIIYENLHIQHEQQVEYCLPDSDAEHQLIFELFGKLPEHTKIDQDGAIIKDALLLIKNVSIDEIDISQVMEKLAVYSHDFNGTQSSLDDVFRGALGCNGTVRLNFSTPLYLWLLENM